MRETRDTLVNNSSHYDIFHTNGINLCWLLFLSLNKMMHEESLGEKTKENGSRIKLYVIILSHRYLFLFSLSSNMNINVYVSLCACVSVENQK